MENLFRALPHRRAIPSIYVTPNVLREYLPTFEQFCGQHLGRKVGVTNTAGAMVQSLSEHADFASCPDYEGRVARYLLEMISMSYTMGFNSRSSATTAVWRRRNDVFRYIEDHLRDPSLTAEACNRLLPIISRQKVRP